jgi:TPR repeat protein
MKKLLHFILFLLVPVMAWAQSDYQLNIEAAKKGNAKAQYEIGRCYYKGIGIAQSYTLAAVWFHKSAEQGYAKAQNYLGICYRKGQGVAQDYSQAFYWYYKAAVQGYAAAQYNLGLRYLRGQGTALDYTQAISWFGKSAGQGYAHAQSILGECYYKGEGVVQDYAQAVYWFRKAADLGDTDAKKRLPDAERKLKAQKAKEHKADLQALSDVDSNIPTVKGTDENTFVVIIGNEKYHDEADVPFAENDAKVFREYCQKTLGITEKHIRMVINASFNDIRKAVSWLSQGVKAYNGQGRVIFYYAGHGIPNEKNQRASLLPVDGIGSDPESAYSLETLYLAFADMPVRSVTVFLDACFSGTKRDGEMMNSARGVAIKVKSDAPKGKMVVFSAAQGDETAYPYTSQNHGLFTYYLLRKIQETKGVVTLGELSEYLASEVKRKSFDENSKIQTPSVDVSPMLANSWSTLKLR